MKYLTILLLALLTVSCTTSPRAITQGPEQAQVAHQQSNYVSNQPPPYFERSLERYLMTELYKKRNEAVGTWSYVQSQFTGKVLWSCPSVGYPIPGGTQLTNPSQITYNRDVGSGVSSTWQVVPQAEPNGMYSPTTALGTYVMCVNPDGTVSPAYVEDNVRTFSQPMQEQNGTLIPTDKAVGIKIDISSFKTP